MLLILRRQNYQLGNWGGYYPVASKAVAHPMNKQSAYELEASNALTPGIASSAGACYPHAAPVHYIERRYNAYVKEIDWERPEIVDYDRSEDYAEL